MRVNSNNEWDQLSVVILGTVENFSPGLEYEGYPDESKRIQAENLIKEAYPKWYLDEVAEDLEGLAAILINAGVNVIRPRWSEASTFFCTPNWAASGFDIYNVRDLNIVFGNTIISSSSASRFRFFENYCISELLYEHFFEGGFRWLCAPLPKLKGKYLHEIQISQTDLQKKEDQLHKKLSHGLTETYHRLDEKEILFDAANIIRVNKDILYLISSTGNKKAARWLQETLGSDYRVHSTDTYRSSHLDSTIIPLCEGKVLLNGARVSEETCPKIFHNWDCIYFTDVAPVPEEEVEFHKNVRIPIYQKLKYLSINSNIGHISSPWAGLNVLSLNPKTVLVHDRQLNLIRLLEAKGFDVIPVRMRHCYSMLGGLHCTTLDVVRKSC